MYYLLNPVNFESQKKMLYLLWSIAHGEAGKISTCDGKQRHGDNISHVMIEKDWKIEARLNVAEHEGRNENYP